MDAFVQEIDVKNPIRCCIYQEGREKRLDVNFDPRSQIQISSVCVAAGGCS